MPVIATKFRKTKLSLPSPFEQPDAELTVAAADALVAERQAVDRGVEASGRTVDPLVIGSDPGEDEAKGCFEAWKTMSSFEDGVEDLY